MTPLVLELEGFTCYRERARIDWSEAGAALFAVTGPTGAGKSTLLDAITYVLYGRTDRLGGRGLEALVSPGADSLFVQLTFRTARGVYRATRSAQRRGGSVSNEVRIEVADEETGHDGWRQLPESEKVREANDALERLVGLDYDGFTRAVLLPQGAFDEFLRGDAALRRKLLVSLLGLDRVGEIQRLAGQRSSAAQQQVTALQTRLGEDYADVDAATLRELQEREAALKAALADARTELGRREAELQTVEKTAQLEEERERLRARRERLATESPRIEALRAELERGRRAAVLAPQIPQLGRSEKRVESTAAAVAAHRSELGRAAAAAAAAAAELRAATEVHDRRRSAIDSEIAMLTELRPVHDLLVRRGGSLALAAEAESAELLDEERWSGWQTALSLVPGFERALRERAGREGDLEKARRAAADAERKAAELSADLERRVADGKRLRAEQERAQEQLELLRRADLAATLRATLAPDDPCPVCGNPVGEHPRAEAHGDLEAAEERVRTTTEAVETAREAYSQRNGESKGAHARHESAVKAVEAAERALGAATAAVADARGELERHGAVRVPDGAASGVAGAAALRGELERHRAAALAAHAAELARRLTAAGVVAGDTGLDLEARSRTLTAERQGLERDLKAAEMRLNESERARDVATSRLESAVAQLREAEEEARLAMETLDAAVAAAGFADRADAESAARDADDLQRLEGRISSHVSEVEAVERRDVELAAELAGRPPLPAAQEGGTAPKSAREIASCLEAALAARRAEVDTMRHELGALEHRRADMAERLERSRELRKQLAGAEDDFELHRQLSLDLRGDRFQEYLMTQVQQRLARRASSILRHVTDGRYDLFLEAGDYLVADAWAGGELRSARTLSGGESFVASLALALALSDTLAGSAALGALFLDEGFGTLDRETLDAVAGVLESLTDEGRMVGVITHVPELSERLPARLVVRKGPGGSSVAWDA